MPRAADPIPRVGSAAPSQPARPQPGRSEPALSRRHAAGAPSARGLLFTVLGEYVLPGGGAAWTATVISTMARLGVEEKATRQALMRTAADGWLTADRRGRRTLWLLTRNAEALLTEGTERIYGFGAHRAGWDGRWLLVLARAPESERAARHVLRSRLTWAGLGSPAPGVWISTHAERLGEVERVLQEAGLANDAQIFRGEHAGGQLAAMVAQAWDLDAIGRAYDEFLTAFADRAARDPLAATIELVHAWRRFPFTDPDLPRQLLPQEWSGVRAAELFRRCHAEWSPAAQEEWRREAAAPGQV
jgi:phenylacetic acid degradation operon negative regulatory protein